jgi:hypothetical protein
MKKRGQAMDAYRNAIRFDPTGIVGEVARGAMNDYERGIVPMPKPKVVRPKAQIEIKRSE